MFKLLNFQYHILFQITAMYIDGNLKGGFQTVKAYAEFCALFKSWMEERSLKIWPPRHGEVLAQDYRDALDYVNKQVNSTLFCRKFTERSTMNILVFSKNFGWYALVYHFV